VLVTVRGEERDHDRGVQGVSDLAGVRREQTLLAFEMVGRRYHATPWGSHVNEGLVEWPPSPWRLLRALVATGFGRLGWTAVEGSARELLHLLGSVLPSYWLPEASSAHTRHYMPIGGGKTTKVLDTFVRLPDGDQTIWVRYPTGLPDASRELLRKLAASLGYLGRAESWVVGRLVESGEEAPLSGWIEPGTRPPAEGHERVETLALDHPEEYAAWRQSYIARAKEALETRERAKADAKGKAFKALPKKDLERIEQALPVDTVSALLQDTGTLRREGWSQPPGTRFVSYYRRADALVPRVAPVLRSVRETPPTAVLLAIASDTKNADLLPSIRNVARFMDRIHETLARSLGDLGLADADWLTGKRSGEPIVGHRHLALLPVRKRGAERFPDDMGSAKFDHVLAVCPMGFSREALAALHVTKRTYSKDLPTLYLTVVGEGEPALFDGGVSLAREATVFRSVTPFVPCWHLKQRGNGALLAQVQRELSNRSLPPASKVEIETRGSHGFQSVESVVLGKYAGDLRVRVGDRDDELSLRFRHVRRERGERRAPMNVGLSLRLTFEQPLRGPVALGFGSHFGLGLFEPEGP
jgi:CRISPR-associated protein Csb2